MYTLDYYENMLRIYSATAEQVCRVRWGLIKERLADAKVILDYGSGVGWFRAWRPIGVEVDSFDIGPYPQTGVHVKSYDLVCFWDVLEHIPDFKVIEPILALAKNVIVSLPILPPGGDISTWKHFKPGEHIHYFTDELITGLFKRFDFKLVYKGTPECPPRVDVWTFIYEKFSLYKVEKSLREAQKIKDDAMHGRGRS